MDKSQITRAIFSKKSYLCVGLDPDLSKLPAAVMQQEDPIFEFNKAIIDATRDYCVAYKPNLAFYESQGTAGWKSLERTLDYIPEEFFTIADAKRGDIGNTSRRYAQAFFEQMDFDAITVVPYMGRDSVVPFLEFPSKWVILLALTSNPGSQDFQQQALENQKPLYQEVLSTSSSWGSDENLMYVVGATQAQSIASIRQLVPNHFLLVPGVGAQGGDLEAVSKAGFNSHCGLLVNASRSILYASSGDDFALAAAREAEKLQSQMSKLLEALR